MAQPGIRLRAWQQESPQIKLEKRVDNLMFGRKENNVIVIKAKNGLGAKGLVAAAAMLEKQAHISPNVTVRLELEGWNEESSNKGDDRNNQGQCADDA